MYIDEHGARWFKGNLHTHTTDSDGQMSPDDCAALYRGRGYDFLSLTDHWKLSGTRTHENGLLLLSGVYIQIHQQSAPALTRFFQIQRSFIGRSCFLPDAIARCGQTSTHR